MSRVSDLLVLVLIVAAVVWLNVPITAAAGAVSGHFCPVRVSLASGGQRTEGRRTIPVAIDRVVRGVHSHQRSAYPPGGAAKWRLWLQGRGDAIKSGDLVSSQCLYGMGSVSRGYYQRSPAGDSPGDCQTMAAACDISGAGAWRHRGFFCVLESAQLNLCLTRLHPSAARIMNGRDRAQSGPDMGSVHDGLFNSVAPAR